MAKILLVQVKDIRHSLKPSDLPPMPLGLIYIASMLDHHGHSVKIHDRNLYPSDEGFKRLLKNNYDFVGFGPYTGVPLLDALDASKIVKENSKSLVVWGGFHATSVPEQTLKNEYIDHIITGEGEETFIKMIKLYEEGKSFSHLNGVDLNPMASPPDINKLPPINYDFVEVDKYPNFFISTSRGCPYRCTFCYNSYGEKCMQPYKELDYDNAVNLIKGLAKKYKKRTFTIVDDNFPSNRERLKKMAEEMQKLNVKFDICCRANYADIETLKTLKKAGCWQIQIGVESGSQKVLNFFKKGTSIKQNAEAIKNCKKVGIMSHCSFMIGAPGEDIEDIRATLDFIKKTKPDLGGVGFIHPFPKTKLWDYCIENGILEEPKSIEEWGNSYPPGFNEMRMHVSDVPKDILQEYYKKLNREINKGKDFKKLILYLKNGRIPELKKVLAIIRSKFKKKKI